jgi:hypothetical protein
MSIRGDATHAVAGARWIAVVDTACGRMPG